MTEGPAKNMGRGIFQGRTGEAGRWGFLVVLLLLSACAPVEVRPPSEGKAAPGFVKGTFFPDNTLAVSLEGAEIRLGEFVARATSGGVFSFPQPPPGKYYLVAEKRFTRGSVRRVLGVSTLYVSESPIELRVRMRDATDVDAFCSDCHPTKKNATRRDQVIRDIHPSGIVPVKAGKPTGKYDEKGRVTCESCHTVHQATGFPHFTLAGFKDGKLCLQCH